MELKDFQRRDIGSQYIFLMGRRNLKQHGKLLSDWFKEALRVNCL